MTGIAHSILPNRISYLLDLHGPSEPIDTACSSSLVAIHRAVENIKNGHCGMAIAGGVSLNLIPDILIPLSQAGMLSPTGRCHTFDENADGYVRGEGVGIVVLKRLSKAKADGNQIFGIIRGTGENHGGKANTLTSPNPQAQKSLLLDTYRRSGIDPSRVGYIEAHGTGTPLGDPIETEGLKLAFEELYTDSMNVFVPGSCGVSSVKTNIGHLEAAAGIAGVLKMIMSLQEGIKPGNPNLTKANKYLRLSDSPFYLQEKSAIWESSDGLPRVAGVSSFGFGGSNAHVILEEYKSSLIQELS